MKYLSGNNRTAIIRSLAVLRTTGNLEEGIAWIERLPESDRKKAWDAASVDWARTDPESAAEFALSTDDPFVNDKLIRSLAQSWGDLDPQRAAEWTVQSLDGGDQSMMLRNVVKDWALASPEEAIGFVASLEEGELKDHVTPEAVSYCGYSGGECEEWRDRQAVRSHGGCEL